MGADVHAPAVRRYLDAAPHLAHADLRRLYERLVTEALAVAPRSNGRPRVLDLGAGEGTATLTLLSAGADVVAVDDDPERIAALRERTASFEARLDAREADARDVVAASRAGFDAVVATSFLHHVPDYLSLVDAALDALRPGGVLLTFQDPLLHASLDRAARFFSRAAYLTWRLGGEDLRGGAARYLRRRRRGFSDELPEDAEEYHAQRGGVDHRALVRLLESRRVPVRLVLYFSTQIGPLHRLGRSLGLENTFAMIGGPVA
jgi:SAM-dependent methyltransferase